jgi:hypothetical protein
MNDYDIDGLIDLKRDINLKLSSYLDENKKRQLFGISGEHFNWKNE